MALTPSRQTHTAGACASPVRGMAEDFTTGAGMAAGSSCGWGAAVGAGVAAGSSCGWGAAVGAVGCNGVLVQVTASGDRLLVLNRQKHRRTV